jgi:hypothetical protein
MRVLAILFATSALLFSQTPPGTLQVQGSIRTRLELWDWFDAQANDRYGFSGNIARLSLSQQNTNIDWQLEFAAPFLLGLPDDAIAPGAQGQLGLGATYFAANTRRQNAGMVFAKQGFVRFKNLFGDKSQSLRLGRFEFSDGVEVLPKDPSLAWVKRERIGQRLIGPFGWSHAGRSFDGLHYNLTRGKHNFTALAFRPTRGAFQVDGWGQLDIATSFAAYTRTTESASRTADYRIFGMYYHDWRNVTKTDARPLAVRQADRGNIRIGGFGAHAANTYRTGAGIVDTLLWGILQTGRWGALDHRAASWLVEAGIQPRILPRLKPWFRAGYSYSTGDSDPADRKHGTFFQFLPTPRPFARMPFFNMMNNEDLFAMAVLRPHPKFTLRGEAHGLWLANRNDLWYAGGGAFQPWTFGFLGRPSGGSRSLANLYDLSADYNPNRHWTLTAYYAHAAGKDVVRNIYPQKQSAHFGYLELVFRY